MRKEFDRIVEKATAGTITRDAALAQIKALQDKAFAACGQADLALDVDDDRVHEYERIGFDVSRPALIVRDRDDRELLLPFSISKAGKVSFKPAEVAAVYAPVAHETAAASRRTPRCRSSPAAGGCTPPQGGPWRSCSMRSTRYRARSPTCSMA